MIYMRNLISRFWYFFTKKWDILHCHFIRVYMLVCVCGGGGGGWVCGQGIQA